MKSIVSLILFLSVTITYVNADLLNVSYDPTREFYSEYNSWFRAELRRKGLADTDIRQSHGGSGKQARAILDGLQADVATLALAYDVDMLASRGLLDRKWRARLPQDSVPYYSTIVLLVRKGNPKGIRDWSDLVKPGVSVITANPKTSGGARWNYLAAWGAYASQHKGNEKLTKEDIRRLLANVPVLDAGARGALTTFAQRRLGDVLITWENEALLAQREFKEAGLQIVYPSLSIRAEPVVAVVDRYARAHNSENLAISYLEGLYSEPGQKLIVKHGFRPGTSHVKSPLPAVKMFRLESEFGNWQSAHQKHFADGGTFDQLLKK